MFYNILSYVKNTTDRDRFTNEELLNNEKIIDDCSRTRKLNSYDVVFIAVKSITHCNYQKIIGKRGAIEGKHIEEANRQ